MKLDKNGHIIRAGQTVVLCKSYSDYQNPTKAKITERDGILMVGEMPLEFYRNSNTDYHSVEIQPELR